MARTDKAVTVLVNGQAVQGAFSAVDQANGMRLVGIGKYADVQVVVRNTAVAAKNVIVRAGSAEYGRASVGDATYAVPANTGEVYIFPETARHQQHDESINVDFESGFTGTIAVFTTPLPS